MWYYERNQKPFGPVSKETIADEIRSGTLSPTTRVWREGMVEWKPLADTELAVLINGSSVSLSDSRDLSTPPTMTAPFSSVNTPHPSRVNPEGLRKIFLWWVALLVSCVPFYLLSLVFAGEAWSVSLTCLYELPLLAAAVLQYILIYKLWQVIQDGHARTTPGKAIGFLFIPFFNLYWYYVAFHGLARDMNGYIERHFEARPNFNLHKTQPLISLIFVIFFWVQTAFSAYLMVTMTTSLISSMGDAAQLSNLTQGFTLPLAIVFVLQLSLLILMMRDFYKAARGIIDTESKQ